MLMAQKNELSQIDIGYEHDRDQKFIKKSIECLPLSSSLRQADNHHLFQNISQTFSRLQLESHEQDQSYCLESIMNKQQSMIDNQYCICQQTIKNNQYQETQMCTMNKFRGGIIARNKKTTIQLSVNFKDCRKNSDKQTNFCKTDSLWLQSCQKQNKNKIKGLFKQSKQTKSYSIKKAVSMKVENKVQSSDQSDQEHISQKVILKKQLTNTSCSFMETNTLKTTKTLKSWRSLNTSKMIFGSERNPLDGAKLQIMCKTSRSTLHKVKLQESCEGYIVRKKINRAQAFKINQVEIMSKISGHPFVACLYDAYKIVHSAGHSLELFMQYYDGGNLKQKIYEQGAFELLKVKLYAFQLFRGLYFLHYLGICHRDINSQNIFLSGDKLVIGDFSEAVQLNKNQIIYGLSCNQVERAPELVFNNSKFSYKTDIWAVGCLMVEMILGRKIFNQPQSNQDLFIQIMKVRGTPTHQQFKSLNQKYENIVNFWKIPIKMHKIQWKQLLQQPNLDTDLQNLLQRLFQYDPNNRFTALQAICHPYFDQIRKQQVYLRIKQKYIIDQTIFTFLPEEVSTHNKEFLCPQWVQQLIQ